jgi:leucyl-tRNA synthetase
VEADAELARDEEITVVVQVNGKVRDRIVVSVGTEEATLERLALTSSPVQPHLAGKQVRKVIVVPDKLVNIVAA